MTNQTAISRAIDASLNAELGILKSHAKAVDQHKAAAAVLFKEYAPEDAEEALAVYSECRTAERHRLEKKLKDAQTATAFRNAFDQIRVFFLILAEPDHGVVLTAGGSAVRAEETVGNIANARRAAKAIVDGDDGAKSARPARQPKGPASAPKIDTVAASAQAFEGDMVKARAAFEAILAMQSGWGMVIDVLRCHGFRLEKAETTAPLNPPNEEAEKVEPKETAADRDAKAATLKAARKAAKEVRAS